LVDLISNAKTLKVAKQERVGEGDEKTQLKKSPETISLRASRASKDLQ
jgi:hypothetical protein